MANVWVKICLQSGYATVFFFFAMLFLSMSGIKLFLDEIFSITGFAIILSFAIFNVFAMLHWK